MAFGKKIVLVSVFFFLCLGRISQGAAMTSDNYQIESDSINVGGAYSSSGSEYRLWDSLGESAAATSSSATYQLLAGFQYMSGADDISISVPADVSLSPNIPTAGGGQANGTVAWTITTAGGYQLMVKASTNPALQRQGGGQYGNYAGVTYDWSVSSNNTRFGFNPFGDDVVAAYRHNGSVCGAGSSESGYCWDGFSLTDKVVAQSGNAAGGKITSLNLRAEAGLFTTRTAGTYSAAITATAVSI